MSETTEVMKAFVDALLAKIERLEARIVALEARPFPSVPWPQPSYNPPNPTVPFQWPTCQVTSVTAPKPRPTPDGWVIEGGVAYSAGGAGANTHLPSDAPGCGGAG